MILYHGSSVPGLKELKPCFSKHKKPYIYFSTDIVVAAFYTVHKFKRPYNWFTYGFNKDGIPIYTEYYSNALADVYDGHCGYIYQCRKAEYMGSLININDAYVCPNPVVVDKCVEINNVYTNLLEYEKSGRVIIRRFEELSDNQRININRQMQQEILKYDLLSVSECDYSKFIRKQFPKVWEDTNTGAM